MIRNVGVYHDALAMIEHHLILYRAKEYTTGESAKKILRAIDSLYEKPVKPIVVDPYRTQ